VVRDLASTNGTFLNGAALSHRRGDGVCQRTRPRALGPASSFYPGGGMKSRSKNASEASPEMLRAGNRFSCPSGKRPVLSLSKDEGDSYINRSAFPWIGE
jgi:hypothetical protein